MPINLFLIILFLFINFWSCSNNSITGSNQQSSNTIRFYKSFGGNRKDVGESVYQTSDGGYIITGRTDSYGNGETDLWIIKTNLFGMEEWSKTLGGSRDDEGYSVIQSNDGSYIVLGRTESSGNGESDIWIMKINSLGNIQWEATFGGPYDDWGFEVQQTSDRNFILIGSIYNMNNGRDDICLIKINPQGKQIWKKEFGGPNMDIGYSVRETIDNGFILLGYTQSFGAGIFNILLIKTDEYGEILWEKVITENSMGIGNDIIQSHDGGYVITGGTSIPGQYIDLLLLKTDEYGNKLWSKTFGSIGFDAGFAIHETIDQGIIISGVTSSQYGQSDTWLIKTNSNGTIEWSQTYGKENDNEDGLSVLQTDDHGYIITGTNSGNISLIKTDINGNIYRDNHN